MGERQFVGPSKVEARDSAARAIERLAEMVRTGDVLSDRLESACSLPGEQLVVGVISLRIPAELV